MKKENNFEKERIRREQLEISGSNKLGRERQRMKEKKREREERQKNHYYEREKLKRKRMCRERKHNLNSIRININKIDVFIEIRDSRMPISSRNYEIDRQISLNQKKKIIIFNKFDLCNKRITNIILE